MNSKWPRVMLLSAVSMGFLLYDMATASEAPRQAVAILEYALLACAVVGLIGSAVMYAADR